VAVHRPRRPGGADAGDRGRPDRNVDPATTGRRPLGSFGAIAPTGYVRARGGNSGTHPCAARRIAGTLSAWPTIHVIRTLLDQGVVVICAGGGGIPTAYSEQDAPAGRRLEGVEAVIDKDLASALLAIELGADALLV
jgi:hypothetical protein